MCHSFGYTRVLNMPLVLNMPGFWIHQSSEYAKVTQGLEFAWVIPKYACICLIMFGYVLEICLNMSEYAWICLNMPEWLLVLHFSISLLVFAIPWKRGYLFERLQETRETRGYSLKKQETVFLKKQNLIFSLAAGSISFVFCFRLNIFTSKI